MMDVTGANHQPELDRPMQAPVSRLPLFAALLCAAGALFLTAPAQAMMPPLRGALPAEVSAASAGGLFVPKAQPTGLAVNSVQAVWRIPVILVSYTDQPLAYSAADFDLSLFDASGSTPTGSVRDYYRWVSGGRLTVQGQVVATVHLPHDKYYYGFNAWGLSRTATPNNTAGLVRDALLACDAQVNWTDFDLDHDGFVDMLWVVHSGIGGEGSADRFSNDLWSITSRLAGFWSNSNVFETHDLVPGSETQHILVDRFSCLPELSNFLFGHQAEIGVYCHEFGHALGLPDLYDTRSTGGPFNVGPGNWSLMGSGVYGGNGHSPEYPTHLGAWPCLFLGWAQPLQPARDTTLVLPPLSQSQSVLELSFQGQSYPEHFLVETRTRTDFDRNLPAEGLIVYHVDEAVIGQGIQSNTVNSGPTPGLTVVEADGGTELLRGYNRGDAGDAFPGSSGRTNLFDSPLLPNTLTFQGAPTSVGLFEIEPVTGGVQFYAQVRAPGWQAAADRTVGEYAPAGQPTAATTVAQARDGTVYSVASEVRAGHLQIVLRSKQDGAWGSGEDISASPGDAFEPALTSIGNDGLGLAWSDTRGGQARIYYRALVNGVWTAPAALPTPPGQSRSPALSADGRGEVHLAWIATGSTQTSVEYLRFPYLTPFGQPISLSLPDAAPANPCVTTRPSGGAVISWTDNAVWPPRLWYVRSEDDGTITHPDLLTRPSSLPQSWASVSYDDVGDLHSLWIERGTSESELHYRRVTATGLYAPEDTTLETSPGTLANARLTCDQSGGLHTTFEQVVAGVTQIGYGRYRTTLGWDAASTDLTTAADGSSYQPRLVATSPGNVTVLYLGYAQGTPHLMERCRLSDAPPVAAVASPSPPSVRPGVLVRPNPVRAGQSVEIRVPGAGGRLAAEKDASASAASRGAGPAAALEVFDLAGRRVARVPLAEDGSSLRARLGSDLTARWPTGVYLLRVRAAGETPPAQRLVVLH